MQNSFNPSTFLNAEVSLFKNCGYKKPLRTITFNQWLNKTSTDLIDKIQLIRSDPDKYKPLKKELPAITGSGVFSPKRSKDTLSKHSGFLIVDLDGKDNKQCKDFMSLKTTLFPAIPEIVYAGLSCSGRGYWVVIGIEKPEYHRDYYKYIERQFKKLNLVVDSSCIDVSRLRYYSYDDKPYINPKPQLLIIKEQKVMKNNYTQTTNTIEKLEDLTQKIERTGISIAPDYDTYFSIACSIANEYGEAGRPYYHRICQIDIDYDPDDADKDYSEALERNYNYSLGTLIHCMREKGVI